MLRLLTIPVILAALVAAAMTWSGSGAVSRADFAFVNRGDNKCLDPNGMSWMQDIRIAYALWEGLYTLDPVTIKPILGTADRVEVDPTQTIWTFHIRPNARWSNGDPVKAADFVFSWRRFLETPGEYTYLHFYIKGAKKYQTDFAAYLAAKQSEKPGTAPNFAAAKTGAAKSGTAPNFSTVGELAVDDQTLRVTLTDPVPFFPALLAFPCFFPMHEPSMRPFLEADKLHFDQRFTRPPNLVSNGPYHLAEWRFKDRLRMIASDFYWDRANVKSRVVDQVYADDALAAYRAYERGDVDWIAEVDADIAGQILSRGGRPDLHIFPAFGTYFYSLNCLPKLPEGIDNPLKDIRVRQALSMAIDKEPIVEKVGRLGQKTARTYVPLHVFPGYPSPAGLPYDVPAAQKLLADAGYPGGRGFPALEILYNSESVHADVAQIIRQQWQANLGIDTHLQGVEVKIFGARLHSQQYDIARASWYGDYDDPSTFTDKYKSDSDDNDSKWVSPQYDALCAAAAKEPDPQRRFALLSQAENTLLTEAPIIPLYYYVNAYMFRANVTGLPLSPNGTVMFKSIHVER
jgi:oligopeptide transport system substrate-binding protein